MAAADKTFREPVTDATMQDYRQMLEDRPYKFDQHAVDYKRAASGEPRCDGCLHYFEREIDQYHVCEILRPEPEQSIMPEFRCRFQTADGEKFPLYKDGRS